VQLVYSGSEFSTRYKKIPTSLDLLQCSDSKKIIDEHVITIKILLLVRSRRVCETALASIDWPLYHRGWGDWNEEKTVFHTFIVGAQRFVANCCE